MSKNPYDLRAGLLGQAQAILNDKYHSDLEAIRRKIELDILDASKVTWPNPPTSDDIITEAEKLYKFVCTK
tara:strand:- start:206 stop:418 length:213 start_codon:yes stop_codon:yes gene_type:complete